MKSQNIMAMVVSICLLIIGCSAIRPTEVQNTNFAKSTFAKKVMRDRIPTLPTVQVVKIDDAELACLQENIYFEAGNQSERGKEAVAAVTLNRTKLKNYPETVCGVVYQRSQFSWTRHRHRPNLKNVLEYRQWVASRDVAIRALSGNMPDVTKGATHYHATYVNPSWSAAKRMRDTVTIGVHVFYTDTKLKLRDA